MNKNKYQPISIWDYNTGVFNYSFEVTHEKVDSKIEAEKIANYSIDKFGIFINRDELPKRVLMFGAILEDETFKHIPKNKVNIKLMNIQAAERLSPSIPLDCEENKNKAIDALMNLDENYMITDDDYMDFKLPLERIEKTINITPDAPLFFDSIAYQINES